MEGLIKRAWIAAVVVGACGAFTIYVPPARSKPVDETWMADHAPMAIGDYKFNPAESDADAPPGQSYRMGSSTYKTLQPSGICSRFYTNGDKKFDVVLIASDNSVSFHDPRVCFTASGWNITHQEQGKLHTQSHGDVPATLVEMQGDGEKRSALYLYRSPGGYESVARKMRWDMLMGELLHGRNDQGVFYRFIPMTHNISDEELQNFASAYLDEAKKVSGGFF